MPVTVCKPKERPQRRWREYPEIDRMLVSMTWNQKQDVLGRLEVEAGRNRLLGRPVDYERVGYVRCQINGA